MTGCHRFSDLALCACEPSTAASRFLFSSMEVCGSGCRHGVLTLCLLIALMPSCDALVVEGEIAEWSSRAAETSCGTILFFLPRKQAELWDRKANFLYFLAISLTPVVFTFCFFFLPHPVSFSQVRGQSARPVQLSGAMDACARIRGVPIRSRASIRKEVCLLGCCILSGNNQCTVSFKWVFLALFSSDKIRLRNF